MTDLALLGFIVALLLLGLRRPFVWVLAYIYIDTLAPQDIGWRFVSAIPVSLIAFCAAFGGWLLADSKHGARFGLRQALLTVLLAWCFVTTMNADFPVEAAHKWDWVWKALVFAIFLPLTLTTRLRIEAAILTMVLTAGAIVIDGGIKTATGGGGYGVLHLFVQNNTGMYESSTIATVAIAIIPLILWAMKHGTVFPPDWRVKWFAYALIFACLLIPIGTEARTGLLCIAVLAVLMLRDVKRRFLYVFGAAALGLLALPFVPSSWYARMSTLENTDADTSASTRVAVWEWTIDYANNHPMGGGFDAYRGNKFTYKVPVRTTHGEGNTSVRYEDHTDQARAYHSAVFEMLGEQGWPGLGLWLWIHLLGLWQMERIRRRWKGRSRVDQQWQAPLAVALQFAQAIYLVGSLFQGIAYQPFVLTLIGVQCALWTWCRLAESPPQRKRHRPAARTPSAGEAVTAGATPLR
ncbi:putative O-glycosylation ligase, exosortase A system-associated [Tsuneonella sp. YG55]|uniref:O-glycosylation ligase, exosortase A system-associated n=1 Tax=Tsuneonella litorea TaxID=2976475 RepID=A0A9X3A8D1_9SPHN|nr:putative O-glycosylation ligase, exosortase A system-associated [Tsuneonella litorea]MCT2557715.1 putative O-glycosylation ligase, exosortase A system-associated [Tsuneonella litorea]